MRLKEISMDNTKVKVTSMVKGRIGVSLPDLRFKREWPRMGTSIPIDMSILQEAIFDPGFNRMVREGVLIIDDKKARIELGLESEESESSVFVLNEMQMVKLLKVSNIGEFEATLKQMSGAQRRTLADIAIEKEIDSYDKTELIKKYCGIDVRHTIDLNRQNKEEVAVKNEQQPNKRPLI